MAALIGDPVRAQVLWALLDGRAYTATELAVYTGTTAQNLSMHLNKLIDGELLTVEKQGRHRYYSYARPEIADVIEGMANLVPGDHRAMKKPVGEQPVEYCRTCYDHLAGKVGVMLTEKLTQLNYLEKEGDDFRLTDGGETWLHAIGVDIAGARGSKRRFARACLDWSERRHHLAGALGAALLQQMLDNGWLRKKAGTRAVLVTRKGQEAFQAHLRLEV